jgi:pimeloyl-ACP methyl ester carboxylesterase
LKRQAFINPFNPHEAPTMRFPTEHKTLEIDGLPIFYREAGPPGAPVLLLPHGYPSSSFQYRNFMPALADRWRLVAPDYPGFGYSGTPDNSEQSCSFEGYADFLEAFTGRLGLERYALYLHDYGSQIGLRLAMRHPERVAALVIQNGDIYEDQLGPKYQPIQDYWANPTQAARAKLEEAVSEEGFRKEFIGEVDADLAARIPPDLWRLSWPLMDHPRRRAIAVALMEGLKDNLAIFFPREDAAQHPACRGIPGPGLAAHRPLSPWCAHRPTSRPRPPMVRTARPSWRPPRGPVVPNRMSLRPPMTPPASVAPPPPGRRPRRRRGFGAALELLVSRLAVHRLFVDPRHQRTGQQRLRCSGVIGPIWLPGGSTYTRSVTLGRPLASSRLTSASPTASSVMAVSMSSPGFGRMVSAVAFTAFWSRGVKARSACCTRLPSWASTAVRDVQRVLGHEIHADALGPHQPHHQLDALDQHLGRLVEQQVRLVEEEHQLGLFQVADLRAAARTARTASTAGRWRTGAANSSACRRPGC